MNNFGFEYQKPIPHVIITNTILKNEELKFYVSFNKSVRDYGCVTTALVINNKYLILEGDHRKNYSEIIDSKEACIDYFKNNINLISRYSDTL